MAPNDPKPDTLTGRASLRAGTYVNGELQQTPSQKAAAGPQAPPTTVRLDILRDGSFNGVYYHTGDTLDVSEEHVDALTRSGFAARADRAARAQQARDQQAKDEADDQAAADARAAARTTRPTTAVQPLGTHDVPGAEPAATHPGEPPAEEPR